MNKTASLYSISPVLLPISELHYANNRIKTFLSIIRENTQETDYYFKNSPYILSILEKADDFIFGSFGKCTDPKNSPLIRLRDLSSFSVIDTDDVNFLIEDYSFFYFDFERMKCLYASGAVMDFKLYFIKYLMELPDISTIYERIDFSPVFENRLDNALNKMKTISSLKFCTLNETIAQSDINSITTALSLFQLSNENVKKIEVTFNLKDCSTPSFFQTLKDNFSNKLLTKIKGKNEFNSDLILDTVTQELTKKINIKLKEKAPSKEDLISIREVLKNAMNDLL